MTCDVEKWCYSEAKKTMMYSHALEMWMFASVCITEIWLQFMVEPMFFASFFSTLSTGLLITIDRFIDDKLLYMFFDLENILCAWMNDSDIAMSLESHTLATCDHSYTLAHTRSCTVCNAHIQWEFETWHARNLWAKCGLTPLAINPLFVTLFLTLYV